MMEGNRPSGKHDIPLTRRGDQRGKLSGVDYVALRVLRHRQEQAAKALQHREEQEAKALQKRLREIKNIVRRLQRCCWPQQDELLWPDENDLERLHVLVSELVRRIRKRPLEPRWKRYKAVDDYWHLRLWQTLSDLVDRAASNAPRRPLEDSCFSELTRGKLVRTALRGIAQFCSKILPDRRIDRRKIQHARCTLTGVMSAVIRALRNFPHAWGRRRKTEQRFSNLDESPAMTLIEIRPHRNGGKVFEVPGVKFGQAGSA